MAEIITNQDAQYAFDIVKEICTEVGPGLPGTSQERERAAMIKRKIESHLGAENVAVEEVTMVHTKLANVVERVRLRYAIPFVFLLIAVYVLVIHPWMTNWGSTPTERQMVLPGDDLIPESSGYTTKAITINAPSGVVWQWLVQIGQDRAGFYTYTWLENLIGADIHNANEIHPEWQHLAVGDAWRLVPPDYLWGLGKDAADPVLFSQPGHALVLEMFGAHVVVPIDDHTSRLLVRGRSGPANLVMTMVAEPIIFTMERRMLLGLKARAEGRPDVPAGLTAIAQIGWVAAGIAVAALFLSQRRRLYWLALPVAAALPALLMSSDLQAALAAFIAVGIIVLGFLTFGRGWWGAFLVIASVVMLTLLLAPEAYIAIGLGFALLLLAALVVMIAGRSGTMDDAAGRLAMPTQ